MSHTLPERGLPASLEAERSILGAIQLDNAAYYESGDIEHYFSLDSHRRIYKRAAGLIGSGRSSDIVTLAEELGQHKEIEAVGGVAYLASLTEGLPRRPSIKEYVDIVKDKWTLREAISICSDAVTRAFDQSEDAADLVADADRRLLEIACGSSEEKSLAEQMDTAWQELEELRSRKTEPAVITSVRSLNRIIGGYKRKKLYIIAGRTSLGKTSMMIDAAIQHCHRGIRTRLISLEMTAEELGQRIFAAVSEVPYERVVEPTGLSDEEWKRVKQAQNLVKEWPLEIDDRNGQTIDSALAGCRKSCRRRGTGFVALDYVQILRFTGPATLRYQEISDASRKLREFAKVENVPVLMLSSITETGDKNQNRRPTLADLKGSGDLAFHADVAILIHRERGEDGASIDTRSELVVAKQRGGRTGAAYATYNTDSLLFEDQR
jgi:replicative DNA helicase